MKKVVYILFALIAIGSGAYWLGPTPETPILREELPTLQFADPEIHLQKTESQHNIKQSNQAEIVWNGARGAVTEYCIVYLHGFAASKMEGEPTHKRLAKALGANLYLSRLAFHGIDTVDAMKHFTVDSYWQSAQEALQIGKKLGKKVILLGCSTGSTLALMLAARYPEVHMVLNISPNVKLKDPASFLLNNPWGLQIARQVIGGESLVFEGESEEIQQYWYTSYRIESLTQLQELLESQMSESLFRRVKQPCLNLYYCASESACDALVDTKAIELMHSQLGTPHDQKELINIPSAGDHVMGSYLKSKDTAAVSKALLTFCQKHL